MKVLLKCKCTDGEIAHSVRDRNEGEDIANYMQYVQLEIGYWHQYRQCSATTLEYLKMPIADGKGIGES